MSGLFAIDYDSHIQPIFNQSCTTCHSPATAGEANLDLSSYDGLLLGGDSGSVIDPYNSSNSLLWAQINQGQMPQGGNQLSDALVQLVGNWIDNGALPSAETTNSSDLNLVLGTTSSFADDNGLANVNIIFHQYAPIVNTETVYSNSDGSFYKLADLGYYNIEFQADGYNTFTISEFFMNSETDLGNIILCDSATTVDECGVCGGDGTSCVDPCESMPCDCLGVVEGTAVVDECGVCNGMNQDMDCEGACFGDATYDCNGTCNGSLEFDVCGTCGGDGIDPLTGELCDYNNRSHFL